MSDNREAKIGEAIRLYRMMAGVVQKSAGSALLEIDLPMTQMKVLFLLTQQPEPITVGRLGEELHIGLPAASRLVDRLIQVGLVTRAEDPADRRRILIRLSPRGEALMEDLSAVMRDRVYRLLSQLREDDLDALLLGLHAMEAVVEHRDIPG